MHLVEGDLGIPRVGPSGSQLRRRASTWTGVDVNAAHQVLRRFFIPTATFLALLVSFPVMAQEDESEPNESEGLEDIYVTAERRETRLQETPVAISVFSGADLNQQGYLDFEDVSFSVPNVQYGRTLVGSGGVTIRGISSSAGDRSTAFHFDGIYINRGGAAEGLTFYDIKQVEAFVYPKKKEKEKEEKGKGDRGQRRSR